MKFNVWRLIPRKKTIINFIFLLPLITCVSTSIAIREFVKSQKIRYPEVIEENIEHTVNSRVNFILDLPNTDLTEDRLYNIAEAIDSQEGVAAVLYKKDKNKPVRLYNFQSPTSGNIEANFFRKRVNINKLKGQDPYEINQYPNKQDEQQRIYYLTYDDYVILWTIRPDFVGAYFVDFEQLLLIVTCILFIITISTFISLISYYCLKNKVGAFVAKHNCKI